MSCWMTPLESGPYFAGHYRLETGIVALLISVMLAYKLVVLGPWPLGK